MDAITPKLFYDTEMVSFVFSKYLLYSLQQRFEEPLVHPWFSGDGLAERSVASKLLVNRFFLLDYSKLTFASKGI